MMRLLSLVCLLCAASPGVLHGAVKVSIVKAKTVQVTAFKNGTALFSKEVVLKGSGWYQLKPPAGAVLGSFWFSTPKGTRVKQVVAKKEKVTMYRDCLSMTALLRANVGRKATLVLAGRSQLTGVVQKSTGKFFAIKTETGSTIVQRKSVLRVSFAGAFTRRCAYQKLAPRLRVQIASKASSSKLRFSYIQKGLEWTPLYRLALGKKTALVQMQAAVVNHLEPFEKAKLDLVVGVPNLLNRSTLSPLSIHSILHRSVPLRRYISPYANAFRAQSFSNLNSRRIRHRTRPSATGGKLLFGKGQDLGNLFAFKAGLASVAKDARALFPVLRARLPIRRFFLWQPDQAKTQKAYHRRYRRYQNLTQVKQNRVWEYLELKNNTRAPLTTGPATLTYRGRFLGQDKLRYTPPGGKVEIPISVAANVLSRQSSVEISRQRNARKIRYRWYALVHRQVTMSLVNFSNKSIQIRVRKRIFGKVINSIKAKVRSTGDGSSINRHSELSYKVTLQAGKRWTTKFQYSAYVY